MVGNGSKNLMPSCQAQGERISLQWLLVDELAVCELIVGKGSHGTWGMAGSDVYANKHAMHLAQIGNETHLDIFCAYNSCLHINLQLLIAPNRP